MHQNLFAPRFKKSHEQKFKDYLALKEIYEGRVKIVANIMSPGTNYFLGNWTITEKKLILCYSHILMGKKGKIIEVSSAYIHSRSWKSRAQKYRKNHV